MLRNGLIVTVAIRVVLVAIHILTCVVIIVIIIRRILLFNLTLTLVTTLIIIKPIILLLNRLTNVPMLLPVNSLAMHRAIMAFKAIPATELTFVIIADYTEFNFFLDFFDVKVLGYDRGVGFWEVWEG